MTARWCSIILPLLGACGPDPEPTEPTGSRFWISGGGQSQGFAMVRDGDQIELQNTQDKHGRGSLTAAGQQAWDDAIASLDPDDIIAPYTCAVVDGVDVCVDVESSTTGERVEFCYCASHPEPEFAVFDAYFSGLAVSLSLCESSEHITVESC